LYFFNTTAITVYIIMQKQGNLIPLLKKNIYFCSTCLRNEMVFYEQKVTDYFSSVSVNAVVSP